MARSKAGHIFISYSHSDDEIVRRILRSLATGELFRNIPLVGHTMSFVGGILKLSAPLIRDHAIDE